MTSESPGSAERGAAPEGESTAGVAFVAGATGYTGLALVSTLLKRDFKVFAHIRPDSRRRDHWVDYFSSRGAVPACIPWEQEALGESLAEVQPHLVFALVGTTRARARQLARDGGAASEESYDRVDYGLTAMLIQAAKRCTQLSRFVYLSAIGAEAGARSAYMKARWRAEEELRNSGLSYTIARPALISGSDREDPRALERVGALSMDLLLSLGAAVGLKGAKAAYASITSQDLAVALAELALNPNWQNRVAMRQDFP